MKDWKLMAKKWSDGEIVASAELGGIGPGYEQAIQILLWELLVHWPEDLAPMDEYKAPTEEWRAHVNNVVHLLNEPCLGFTGAQVGVASTTAFQFIVYGYENMMAKLPEDRKIMVSKAWPKVA